MADQAVIPAFNKGVLLIGREFVQEEIDNFSGLLYSGLRDRWIQDDGRAITQAVTSDNIVSYPSLYTSPGLREDRRWSGLQEKPRDKDGRPIELAYIIVVRGRSAGLFSKVRVFYSTFAVAAGILEEALQGFSVVFSAAILKRDVSRLTHRDLPFRKAHGVNTLIQAADEEEPTILLWC